MVREIKPGKRFKYSLQSVLKVRVIREKKEQEKFAQRQKEFYDEKTKEQQIQDEKKEQNEEFKRIAGKGEINFTKMITRRQHLNILKEALDEQIEKVIEASQKLDKQRDKLLDAVKDRKIMDKDKEHQKERYDEIMKQVDLKFMDEIATLRHSRREKT